MVEKMSVKGVSIIFLFVFFLALRLNGIAFDQWEYDIKQYPLLKTSFVANTVENNVMPIIQ